MVRIIFILLGVHILYVTASINVCLNLKKGLAQNLPSGPDDSFFVPDFQLSFKHPALRMDGDFKNLTIWGTTHTTTAVLQNDQIYNLTFSNIKIVGDYYNLTGNIGELFDIFGTGSFWLNVTDFSLSFSILGINLNTTNLCAPVSVDIDLQQIKVQFNNFMNDPDLEILFNKGFSTIVPDIVRGVWQEMKDGNEARIEKDVNDFINGLLGRDAQLRTLIDNYFREEIFELEKLV